MFCPGNIIDCTIHSLTESTLPHFTAMVGIAQQRIFSLLALDGVVNLGVEGHLALRKHLVQSTKSTNSAVDGNRATVSTCSCVSHNSHEYSDDHTYPGHECLEHYCRSSHGEELAGDDWPEYPEHCPRLCAFG